MAIAKSAGSTPRRTRRIHQATLSERSAWRSTPANFHSSRARRRSIIRIALHLGFRLPISIHFALSLTADGYPQVARIHSGKNARAELHVARRIPGVLRLLAGYVQRNGNLCSFLNSRPSPQPSPRARGEGEDLESPHEPRVSRGTAVPRCTLGYKYFAPSGAWAKRSAILTPCRCPLSVRRSRTTAIS